MTQKRIYVASSWRNKDYPNVVDLLRKQEHLVYDFRNPVALDIGFSWSDLDDNWENWTTFEAMEWADTCVLVLPSGRSAHSEAGWMAGMGKKVYVLSPDKEEPELMYKLYDGVFESMVDLIVKLEEKQIDPITDTALTLLQTLSNTTGASFEDQELAVEIISLAIKETLKSIPYHSSLEENTLANMKIISSFMDHIGTATGIEIPESIFLSFFNA